MRTEKDQNYFSKCVAESKLDFRVDTRIYSDPFVFDEEMRRIYENTWIYVGHVSELENTGDYKTTQIGLNPVILSRAEDGNIHVLLNQCRHRGNAVCREFNGNVKKIRLIEMPLASVNILSALVEYFSRLSFLFLNLRSFIIYYDSNYIQLN